VGFSFSANVVTAQTTLYWGGAASDLWTNATWSTNPTGPFTTAWTDNSNVIFNASSTLKFATCHIGNLTIPDGITVTITKDGTLKTNNLVRTFTIGTGSTLTWTAQPVSTNSTSGFIKNGAGIWDIGAQSNDYTGGFTMNSGTVIVSGNKSFGGGGSLLTINGGTLQIQSGTAHSNNIIIGGNYTFTGSGTTSFSGTVDLGAATRTITNSITGGSRTFSGVISGQNGAGLTIGGSSTYPIVLTGLNTYDGTTTINGSILQLNAIGGALKSGNAVNIGGGTLQISQSQTIGNLTMTSGTLKVDAGQTLTITGTYNVIGGTINNLGTIILKGSAAQTFPGSATTINNGTVGQMTNLIIDNNTGVELDKSFSVSSLTLTPSTKLTLNTGLTLNVTTFNINHEPLKNSTFIDNGTTNTTSVIVKMQLNSAGNWHFSSPITNATVPSSTTNTHSKYNEQDNSWTDVSSGSSLAPGAGYVAMASAENTLTLTGNSLNNGNKSFTLSRSNATNATYAGFNLVGNPYPSYLNLKNATRTNLGNSYWYRSKNSGNTTYIFETYNLSAGCGTSLSGVKLTDYIPPMQAFWLRVDDNQTSGTLALTNSFRSHQDDAGNTFRAPAATNLSQQILRLRVSNGTNADEAIVLFNPNAANGLDEYDSPKMTNGSVSIPEIYTTISSQMLAINGLNQVQFSTEIPLGFSTKETNSYTIKASEFSNFDAQTHVYLLDKDKSKEWDLTSGNDYSFTSDATTSTSRFSLVFRSSTTGVDTNKSESKVLIYKSKNNQIVVNLNGKLTDKTTAQIFNALGQQINSKRLKDNVTVMDGQFSKGVYFVSVSTRGKVVTQKIVVD
jgi:autotransporter-associated beta strand protein